MAFTLIEYMKTTTSELLAGVIEEFARTSPILELLPFKEIIGNALTYNKEDSLPGIAFRGVNEAYDEDTGVINPETENLKILGGDADTDRALQKWEKNFGERRATDLMMKVKAAALYFTKCFFDGDESSAPREFDGLNVRLTGNQVITDSGGNGANLSESFMNQLIDAVQGRPDALYMGKKCRRQVNNLAKSSTILTVTKDQFGEPIQAYAGIPIYVIEEDNSDNTILAFDETKGSSSGVCASMYAVKFGVDTHLCGLQTEPLEAYDLGELDTKPAFRSRIEWLITIAIFHSKSAARLEGITAAVS